MVAQRCWQIFFVVLLVCFFAHTTILAQELDLCFDEVEFSQIFRALGKNEGLNVLVDPSVVGRGTFEFNNVSFQEALDLIARHGGFAYRLSGNNLIVATPDRLLEFEDKAVRYVPIQNLSSGDVFEALALIMPRSDVYVHPQGGLVVLRGAERVLNQAEELLTILDGTHSPIEQPKEVRSLLEIFRELSDEMGLNLVADPSLDSKTLHFERRGEHPEELIEQIQALIPINVRISEHSLVVGNVVESTEERVKVYSLNYVEPETTKAALSALLPEEQIRLDNERKSVIIRGTDLQLAEIDLFMIDFDTPLPQVVLELWVQEMSIDAIENLGIEWRGIPSFKEATAPIFFELEWDPWELILALRALEDRGEAKLLANPKIATISGKEASIFVGDRVPVVLRGQEDEPTRIEFLESGINLKVTPRISDDLYITIIVKPEVSTFVWKTDSDYPQIRTREAETIVRVKDGQPIILGGLIQEQENELIKRIPFLWQLPVLGKLFQWKETMKYQTEMTIFLIPRIVHGDPGVVDQDFFT